MRTSAGVLTFRISLVLAALLAAAGGAGLAVFLLRPDQASALGGLEGNLWWFSYVDAGSTPALAGLWRIAAAVAAAVIGIVAALRAHSLYDKSTSPILPFLILFFFSLSLEGLRAGTALLFASDRSIDASIMVTRVMYWGRFVGLLGLLVAGLYCVDMKYRRFRVLAGVVFLVSFAVAAYIPVDRTMFLAQMTWKLGDEQGVWFVNLMIGVLVLLTSAGGALIRGEKRLLWLAGGMALLLASRELLFFSLSPLFLAAGLACLTAGAAVCLWVLAVVYRKSGETM